MKIIDKPLKPIINRRGLNEDVYNTDTDVYCIIYIICIGIIWISLQKEKILLDRIKLLQADKTIDPEYQPVKHLL